MTILLYPYNHSQQLEGRADRTSTYPRDPIQEEENYYKKGVKRDREGGAKTPQHIRGPKKRGLPRPSRGSVLSNEPSPSQRNIKNAVTTDVHTLKPSSLAHSLQIHCIGLTGLRSHVYWT